MDALSFISFASWSLIRRIPYNGPPQQLRRLRFAHLFFDVSFNGGWDQYVDASVRILTGGMKAYWGTSAGFPGPLPGHAFKAFFRRHELPCSHYYCAYPEATVRTVRAATALEPKLDAFAAGAAAMDDATFEREYEGVPARGAGVPVSRSTNVFGGAYLLMVLTPIRPGEEDALRAYLEGLGGAGPATATASAARWRAWRARTSAAG